MNSNTNKVDKTWDDLKRQVMAIKDELEERDNAWKQNIDTDDFEVVGGFDYVERSLDVEYVISKDNEYLGARILVAFGGPSIWIDTRRGVIEGSWWDSSYSVGFSDVIGIDDVCRDLYGCR